MCVGYSAPRFAAPVSGEAPVLLDEGDSLVLGADPPRWVVELIEQLDADTSWRQAVGTSLLSDVSAGEPLAQGLAGDAVWAHVQQERLLLQHGGAVVF